MKPEPRIDVEPLSERRWSQIEREVLARLATEPVDERRRDPSVARIGRVALATFAAAAAALLVWMAPAAPRPLGAARVLTGDGPATSNAGDVSLEVGPRTSVLVLERAQDQWLVVIEHGSVRFSVPPRQGRPAFTVEAGQSRVVVIGTAFTVSRAPGARTGRVEVEHGVVRVTEPGAEQILRAGDRWPLEPAASAAPAEVEATGAEAAVVAEAPPDTAAEAPTRRRVARAASEPAAEQATAAAPATAATAAQAAAAPTTAVPTVAAPATAAPATAAQAAAAPAAAAPGPSARERYDEAARLEPRDPARALAAYRQLASEGGPWAATALYAEARLEHDLGHAARARSLLEQYLSEHPRGVNAEDARTLLDGLR